MKWLGGVGLISLCGKLILILACFQTLVVSAEEIAAFRLMDFQGFFETRTRYDEYLTQSIGTETKTTEPRSQREIGLITHSYIYHPNMLNMDISGSLLLDNRSYTIEKTSVFSPTEAETDSTDLTWNFDGALNFLEKKPFPLTLFYNRQNPLAGGGLTETFIQENTQYGVNLGLRRPFSPMSVTIRASRNTARGESAFQIVDDTYDILSVRTNRRFSSDAYVGLDYNLLSQDSLSGSPGLPIQARSFVEHRANLNSRWQFGNQKQYQFMQNASLNTRDNPDRLDTRFSPTFRWIHSPQLESYYTYDFSSADFPGDADSLTNAGSASLFYEPSERLRSDIEVRAERNEEAFNTVLSSYGVATNAYYLRPVFDGTLSLGGGVSYDSLDQKAGINKIDVIEESHTLNGTTRVTLAREFVIDSSVVVTNTALTQTFVEDLDYRLIIIGSETQLQRLVAGNILDGQTVLVSYAVDPGGTYNYSILRTNFNADLAFARYYSVFLRFNDRKLSLESGRPTIPLNSVTLVELGTRANVPLPWWGMSVGGETRYRNQQEDISPFDATNIDVYLTLPLPYRSTFRVSASWAKVNNQNSPEDTNLTRYSALLGSRPWHRLNLTASANHEVDTGGLFETRRSYAKLDAGWQIRKLRISAEAFYSRQTQGSVVRDQLTAFLTVRRDLW